MDKNNSYLGGASKQKPFFQKIFPKRHIHAPNI